MTKENAKDGKKRNFFMGLGKSIHLLAGGTVLAKAFKQALGRRANVSYSLAIRAIGNHYSTVIYARFYRPFVKNSVRRC